MLIDEFDVSTKAEARAAATRPTPGDYCREDPLPNHVGRTTTSFDEHAANRLH